MIGQGENDGKAIGVLLGVDVTAVLFGDLLHEGEAEAAVFGTVQGVVAFEQAGQGIVGDGGLRGIVQGEGGVLPGLAGTEGDGGALRGFADGVVEEVGEGLCEPERVGVQFEAGRQVAVQAEIFSRKARGVFVDEGLPDFGESDGLFVDGVFFDARELQEALHEVVQAVALLADGGGEAFAISGRKVFLRSD